MNQRLHGLLHGRTWRRNDLEVVNLDGTGWHLVKTLFDVDEWSAELAAWSERIARDILG
jgi:hypothetical protein